MSLTDGQFGHEIDGDMFSLAFKNGQGFQEALIFLSEGFRSRTYMAACHISSDCLMH
jgi:hypothetical protein